MVYGPLRQASVTCTPSSLRRFAMRAILRSDPPTARLLSTNMTSLRGVQCDASEAPAGLAARARAAVSIGASMNVGVVMAGLSYWVSC